MNTLCRILLLGGILFSSIEAFAEKVSEKVAADPMGLGLYLGEISEPHTWRRKVSEASRGALFSVMITTSDIDQLNVGAIGSLPRIELIPATQHSIAETSFSDTDLEGEDANMEMDTSVADESRRLLQRLYCGVTVYDRLSHGMLVGNV